MSEFDEDSFKVTLSNFYKIKKRILQSRPISTNETKINEYIESLITSYNSILSYTELHFDNLSQKSQLIVFNKIIRCREILVKCFVKLNCKIRLQHYLEHFVRVEREVLTETESEPESSGECIKKGVIRKRVIQRIIRERVMQKRKK